MKRLTNFLVSILLLAVVVALMTVMATSEPETINPTSVKLGSKNYMGHTYVVSSNGGLEHAGHCTCFRKK